MDKKTITKEQAYGGIHTIFHDQVYHMDEFDRKNEDSTFIINQERLQGLKEEALYAMQNDFIDNKDLIYFANMIVDSFKHGQRIEITNQNFWMMIKSNCVTAIECGFCEPNDIEYFRDNESKTKRNFLIVK